LATHHSKDPSFLRAIAARAHSIAKMNSSTWTCKRCYADNNEEANYCHRCGEYWESSYQNGGGGYRKQDGAQQWPTLPNNGNRRRSHRANRAGYGHGGQGQAPKSPRRQKGGGGKGEKNAPKSPRSHSKGRGKGNSSYNEQSGKGKGQAEEPPWVPLPPPPAPPPAPVVNADPQTVQAEAQLKSMVKIISKDLDSYPVELQEEAKKILKQQEQWTNKKLHKTVNELGKAKKALHEASVARLQHHQAWKNYLIEAVARWETFTKQFAEEEKELSDKVNAAKEAVEAAKKAHLAAAKVERITDDEAVTISDDELMEPKPDAARNIQEGIEQMTHSLHQVKTKADEIVTADEQAYKKARIREPEEGFAGPSASTPHFAMADK